MVAILAFAFVGVMRWSRFQYRYHVMLEQEQHYRAKGAETKVYASQLAERVKSRSTDQVLRAQAELTRLEVEDYQGMAEWARKLVEKYDKARRKPWLNVEPDPVVEFNFFIRRTPW